MTTQTKVTEELVDSALDAFWEVIAKAYPQATSGDLTPLTTIRLSQTAIDAVREWVTYNVPTNTAETA